ncbi:MAG: conserved membrane protein of unknown function [Promethearchaeota archaeon]|nr:MAG: conserved membrane protein of unknown function [Candidatus Lokiarchaeota archaeon]
MKKTNLLKTIIEQVNNSFLSKDRIHAEEKDYFYLYVICVLLGISLANIILRLVMSSYSFTEWMEYFKDIDYRIFVGGMENGLQNFYDEVEGFDYPPYYLYFWYFIFFPFYILPFNLGIYFWDLLRMILTTITINNVSKTFKYKKNIYLFYSFTIFGYAIDTFHNNTNFLITFLLLESYILLNRDKKWASGILFALCTFKINSVIFIPLLLIVKKINWRDLKYYLLPFLLLCIPYFIFPSYFLQMLGNWIYQEEDKNLLLIDAIMWKALQPPHLFFIGLLLLILLENVGDERWRNLLRIIVPTAIIIYMIRLIIILNVPS